MLGLLGSEGYNCSTKGTIVASFDILVSIWVCDYRFNNSFAHYYL